MPLCKTLKQIIKWCIPYGLVECRRQYINRKIAKAEYYRGVKEERIRNYFLSLKQSEQEQEVQDIIEYFKENPFSVYPYAFANKYEGNAFYDKSCGMHYVIHKKKKLYLPKDMTKELAYEYYRGLCIEQDENSPHRYETEGFIVKEGDVIADVGAAEGIWALTYAELAKKIYLFECDSRWLQALQKTFEPWKEKIVIVDKYVSDINYKQNVTLDGFFGRNRIDFIKADIEGTEIKLLEGSKNLLSANSNLKLLLCAYHKKNDAAEIKAILEKNGFKTEFSKRYMLFIYDTKLEEPYIRRGLVRAIKNV